jgi:multidrug efflux system membrane fusion protein
VVLAPRAALRHDGEGGFTWVVSEGRVHRRTVAIGHELGEKIVIQSGLQGGEALVIGDASGLEEGQAVEIAP